LFHANRRTDIVTEKTELTVDFHNCFAEETKRLLAFYWKFSPHGIRNTVLSYSGMPHSLSYLMGRCDVRL